jgi:hypothetical protein
MSGGRMMASSVRMINVRSGRAAGEALLLSAGLHRNEVVKHFNFRIKSLESAYAPNTVLARCGNLTSCYGIDELLQVGVATPFLGREVRSVLRRMREPKLKGCN